MTELFAFVAAEGALVTACVIEASVRFLERKRKVLARHGFLRSLPWVALLIAGLAHTVLLVVDATGHSREMSGMQEETERAYLRRENDALRDELRDLKKEVLEYLREDRDWWRQRDQPQVGPRRRASSTSIATPTPNASGVTAAAVPAKGCPLVKP